MPPSTTNTAATAKSTSASIAVPVAESEHRAADLFNIDGESMLTAVTVVVTSLAPFFVVVFFVMDSLYKNSLAGFVCLVGLVIFLFVFRFLIVYTKMFTSASTTPAKKWCKNYDVFGSGGGGGDGMMHFPSNIFTLTYALVYILTMNLIPVASTNDARAVLYRSIPFIVICTILIVANCIFVKNNCTTTSATALFAVVFTASLSGVCWAYVVASANYRDLGYFREQVVAVPETGADQPLCTICDILKTKYGKST